ncbi:MAG: hypothetical protein GTN74_09140 [Proteobacteria bacterium]|nr:hypothetical protein [Pseudomonadota bacterium]NIS70126.1 hypothetical protein [Pseudomonadota bacterium]
MIRKILLVLSVLPIGFFQPGYGGDTSMIETDEAMVLFEEGLGEVAKDVVDLQLRLKVELEESLGWKLNVRPTILLVRDRERFERMAGSRHVVAYAIPQRNLIVIDYSKMNTRPFSLRAVLKHELCHLLLHRHIEGGNLPKWLDEGVSQWVSEGIAEIIMDEKRSALNEAILSGNYIGLDALRDRFPEERRSLILAYEESQSFVDFITSQFGRNAILDILARLKQGKSVEMAVQESLSVPLDELEGRWHRYLEKRTTWFTYLTRNLYVILFFLAALITIWGFIRVLMKKRRYPDEPNEY